MPRFLIRLCFHLLFLASQDCLEPVIYRPLRINGSAFPGRQPEKHEGRFCFCSIFGKLAAITSSTGICERLLTRYAEKIKMIGLNCFISSGLQTCTKAWNCAGFWGQILIIFSGQYCARQLILETHCAVVFHQLWTGLINASSEVSSLPRGNRVSLPFDTGIPEMDRQSQKISIVGAVTFTRLPSGGIACSS